jgi:hypothetical protein
VSSARNNLQAYSSLFVWCHVSASRDTCHIQAELQQFNYEVVQAMSGPVRIMSPWTTTSWDDCQIIEKIFGRRSLWRARETSPTGAPAGAFHC